MSSNHPHRRQPFFLASALLLCFFVSSARGAPRPQEIASRSSMWRIPIIRYEDQLKDASRENPLYITDIESENEKEVKNDFKIISVIPAIEKEHFTLKIRPNGEKAEWLLVEPFDREELLEQFPEIETDDHRAEIEVVFGTRIAGSTGDWSLIKYKFRVVDSNDETPTFDQSNMVISFDENSDPAAINPIAHVSATDRDHGVNALVTYQRGDVTSYALDGTPDVKKDPGTWFTVNAQNGKVEVKKRLDREEVEKFTIVVVAVDGGERQPNSATATLTVNINDVNDNPPRCEETSCQVGNRMCVFVCVCVCVCTFVCLCACIIFICE